VYSRFEVIPSIRNLTKFHIVIIFKKIVNENAELSVNAIMGMLMKKYKGRVEGKKLIELINKFSTK